MFAGQDNNGSYEGCDHNHDYRMDWSIIGHLVAAQEKVCSSFCSTLGTLQSTPGKSCDDIYQINKASRGVSGNYWIYTTTGVHQVYCDMELECGGYKGGWMRIADLDTSRGDDCPSGWTEITIPVAACIAPIAAMVEEATS